MNTDPVKFGILILLAFLCALACGRRTQGQPEARPSKDLSMENVIKTAHSKYDTAIKDGKSKEEAARVVVEFLKSQKIVKEIKVPSPDTIRVIFTNKEEMILMLGRSRL